MRITMIVAVFPPEPEPAGVMAAELTGRWAAEGHDVAVICPTPNRPSGRRYPGFGPWETRMEEGRRVTRVWSWLIGPERRALHRILENVSFGVSSAAALAREPRPDVAIVESWPILAYLPVLAVAAARRIPLVNYIQDVYPEAAISGGQIREGSLAARVLTRVDGFICRRAAVNIVVGRAMGELLHASRGLSGSHFVVLENWLDVSAIRPVSGRAWRSEVGIGDDEFVALFAGTMGFASGVDVLVEVAEHLREDSKIRIVCVGDGVLREPMARAIQERGLTNLTLLPFQPRERLSEVQSSADIALLTTASGVGASSVPSKLITYLATGRPVVCAAAESDVASLVREEQVGIVVPPGDASELARAIRQLRSLPHAELAAVGARARALAEQRFSLESALRRFSLLFREIGALSSTGE